MAHMTRLASTLALALALQGLLVGCTSKDPSYCDEHSPCASGWTCNLATRTCQPVTNPDGRQREGGGQDSRVGDLSGNLPLGTSCELASQCTSGFCADHVCCDSGCTGACQSCALAGSAGQCKPVPDGQDPDKECAGKSSSCAGSCDGKGACTFTAKKGAECAAPSCAAGTLTLSSCDSAGACGTSNQSCGGYACEAGGAKCKTTCTTTPADCTGTAQCVSGKCVSSLPLGDLCGTNNDACASKLCTDGVCCKVASCGACKKCGAGGDCAAVPNDTSCGTPACSATPGYKDIPVCKTGSCTNVPSLCGGNFLCAAGSCLTLCTADTQCLGTAYCSGGNCLPKLAKGQSCTATAQCTAGLFCTDGICCDSQCTGKCASCKVAGKLGTCSPIPPGLDPDNECAGDPGCASGCNGAGACNFAAGGTSCKSPSCIGASLTKFSCNGTGSCAAVAPQSCGAYMCDPGGTACRTTCTLSSQCATGYFCSLGKCMKFTPVTTGTANGLKGLWGTSASNIWAGGDNGVILHYNGTAWASVASPIATQIVSMWGTGPSDIWAVAAANGNNVIHYNGSSWSLNPAGITVALYEVWGAAANDVWTVGWGGYIYHFDGVGWTKLASTGTTNTLRAVRGTSSTDIWAVGENGTIVHFNGSAWSPQTSGTTEILNTVVPYSATDVWVGGDSWTILRFNGSAWSPVNGVPVMHTIDMLPNSPSDVWAVGLWYGATGHWEGSSWVSIDVGTKTENIGAIRLIGGDLWVVGSTGYTARAK